MGETQVVEATSKIPWQAISISAITILVFVLIIILIKNNKNIKAKGKFKDNEVGLEITDSENSKNNKKQDISEIIENISLSYLSMLKIHPIFTSIFNDILYNTSVIYRERELGKLVANDHKENTRIIADVVTIVNYFLKCYIVSFKTNIEHILDKAKTDIENKDSTFKSTASIIDGFLKDVEDDIILSSTIDNMKITGINFNEPNDVGSKVKREQIPQYMYEIMTKYVKSKNPELYRNLLISKTMMKTHLAANQMRTYSFVSGISFMLNSVLDYLYILCSEIRIEILLDILKKELIKIDISEIQLKAQYENSTTNENNIEDEEIELLDTVEFSDC